MSLFQTTHDLFTGFHNQRCIYPRGRALGGSSAINYMVHTRGNRHDFDNWKEMGNDGWSYEDVLPYFKKSERANIGDYSDSVYHNRLGELSVEYPQYRSGLSNMYMLAAMEAGYPMVDYNGATQMGTSIIQTTTQNGKRHSAAEAFIQPIYRKRKNLHILTSALVNQIIIDPDTKKASGVHFIRNNQTYTSYATKEVILSAGAFHSPQLLMLSGVGPKEHLESLDIDVIKDLPVGKKFWDHMGFLPNHFIVNTTSLTTHIKKIGILEIAQFLQGKGPLTGIGGFEAFTYGKWAGSDLPGDYPDFELIFMAGHLASDLGIAFHKEFNVNQEIYDEVYKPIESPELDVFTIAVLHMQPRTTGTLTLRDKNIFSAPIFDYPYFEEEEDLEAILAGIKASFRIVNTDVMKSIGVKQHAIPVPGCTHLPFNSDDYWRCSIRFYATTVHHQVGSCRMGPEDDEDAVVDPELRVHGIAGLRVADTSVLPTQIAAHSNAVSFMVGEKLADMLKATWMTKDDDSNDRKGWRFWLNPRRRPWGKKQEDERPKTVPNAKDEPKKTFKPKKSSTKKPAVTTTTTEKPEEMPEPEEEVKISEKEQEVEEEDDEEVKVESDKKPKTHTQSWRNPSNRPWFKRKTTPKPRPTPTRRAKPTRTSTQMYDKEKLPDQDTLPIDDIDLGLEKYPKSTNDHRVEQDEVVRPEHELKPDIEEILIANDDPEATLTQGDTTQNEYFVDTSDETAESHGFVPSRSEEDRMYQKNLELIATNMQRMWENRINQRKLKMKGMYRDERSSVEDKEAKEDPENISYGRDQMFIEESDIDWKERLLQLGVLRRSDLAKLQRLKVPESFSTNPKPDSKEQGDKDKLLTDNKDDKSTVTTPAATSSTTSAVITTSAEPTSTQDNRNRD